jgi:hypothetical protein
MKISELIYKVMNGAPKGVWVFMAVAIIISLSGPGFIFAFDLLAMIDLFGVETFVLLYISGFLVFIRKPILFIKTICRENVFVPSWKLIKEDSRCLYFLIPNGTLVYGMCAIALSAFIGLLPEFPIWGFILSGS